MNKASKAFYERRLWEFASEDDVVGVRLVLKMGARWFSYRPQGGSKGDALMAAIGSGSGTVIPILLRAHPSPPLSALNAAISNSALSDPIVMKVVMHFRARLDEKDKRQLPLHAAMGRKKPAVAEFLLSKRSVQKTAGASYKSLNALETLLSRNETLGIEWNRVVRTLVVLGQNVRSNTQINENNRALLDKQLRQLSNPIKFEIRT